jgi:hypothetical protein
MPCKRPTMFSMSVYKLFCISWMARDWIISFGRPTLQWDLYCLFANAAWHTLRPFLEVILSKWYIWGGVIAYVPICIHILPSFLEETMDCDKWTWIKTLQNKEFCCCESPISRSTIFWGIKDKHITAQPYMKYMRFTHDASHIPEHLNSI